jgi:thiamine biosynthesis lipoprotein
MGTVFTFLAARTHSFGEFDVAMRSVLPWLRWVDVTFSTYRPDSDVNRLARRELALPACAPEVNEVLQECARLRATSSGYFDHERHGSLDPSGLVKGWAIERASHILCAAGIDNHLINGGGDIRVTGHAAPDRPWRLGIANPFAPMTLLARVELTDAALATSGTYERGHHIDDPVRGGPATDLVALTVLEHDLTRADGISTAGFARGRGARDWLEGQLGVEALGVTSDGVLWRTSGFPCYHDRVHVCATTSRAGRLTASMVRSTGLMARAENAMRSVEHKTPGKATSASSDDSGRHHAIQ